MWIAVWVLVVAMLFPATSLHAATSAPADKVKAAYIYHFTQFITWPASATADEPFNICVLGDDPIGEELAPANRRQGNGRSIRVRRPQTLREAATCQILYIAQTEQGRLEEILDQLRDTPALTVSSIPDFTTRGGTIGFVTVNKRVRLEINRYTARRADIQISAKLLEVAIAIRDEPSGGAQP